MRRWLSRLDDALLVVVLSGASVWGYSALRSEDAVAKPDPPARAKASETDPPEVTGAAAGQNARQLLATIAVKGRASKTGYARDEFGRGWIDVNRNGCDTRNDMLRRDLTHVTLKANTQGCVVAAGVLLDPYTGDEIAFRRGSDTSTAVQIDHVVALSDAWQKGAQMWSPEVRVRFANDPLNLLAVSEAANRRKRDGDAATWLPANKATRCDYVARQVAVKAAYSLWVTAPERDAMADVLTPCSK